LVIILLSAPLLFFFASKERPISNSNYLVQKYLQKNIIKYYGQEGTKLHTRSVSGALFGISGGRLSKSKYL